MAEKTAALLMDDPMAYFDRSVTRMHGIPRRELEALQRTAMGRRFAEHRASIEIVRKLADRLGNLDANGAFTTQVYAPDRYRGILSEGFPGDTGAKPWPWKDLKPSDFKLPADPNAFQLATAPLTVAQVEALGIDPYQGGFQNVTLVGPADGKLYSFALRPLLPDEKS